MNSLKFGRYCTAFLFVLGLLTTVLSAEERKVALVIGNGNYQELGRLVNPPNDAEDMSAVLRGIGFEVDTLVNGSLHEMEDAVIRLSDRLSSGEDTIGFFFYAGHGVQSGGSNYLIPVGIIRFRGIAPEPGGFPRYGANLPARSSSMQRARAAPRRTERVGTVCLQPNF